MKKQSIKEPKKPIKPTEPRKPVEFSKKETVVPEDKEIPVNYHVYTSYYNDAELDYVHIAPCDTLRLVQLIQELQKTANVDSSTIRIDIQSEGLRVIYDTLVRNPSYEKQLEKYERDVKAYDVKLKNYESKLKQYKSDMKKFKQNSLQDQIEAARERLKELEKQAGQE